ncbi:hypothetical protein [Thermoflexibacter ruber]|uniref:Uncharacterized protein n=1 Tax=Thermoflexibacter ruber TaxID=1003 RepID=A0A1I2IWB5_9BACT|nr:hypothetical protein [Thermoflexibacter ruber]SFF46695.1 hypothetical protein SAMN04488541_10382 [Thermoflexibacter ruber]
MKNLSLNEMEQIQGGAPEFWDWAVGAHCGAAVLFAAFPATAPLAFLNAGACFIGVMGYVTGNM